MCGYILGCLLIPALSSQVFCRSSTGDVQRGYQAKFSKDSETLRWAVPYSLHFMVHSTGILWPSSSTRAHSQQCKICMQERRYDKPPASCTFEPVLLEKNSTGGFCSFLPTQILAWTLPPTCRIPIPHFTRKAFKYLALVKWEHPSFLLPLLLQALQT